MNPIHLVCAIVVITLLVYLFVALLKPELF